MLSLPQLQGIQSKDPQLFEALKQIVAAINSVASQVGVEPDRPAEQALKIEKIAVTAADGIFDIKIADNLEKPVQRPIYYFAEYDTSAAFAQPVVLFMGCSRNKRTHLGNLTLYWRGYTQYFGGEPSTPVTFGDPPTAVVGGGLGGPTPQTSSGSGTNRPEYGGGGFGKRSQRRVEILL